MTGVDWLIVAVFAFFIFKGFKKGFVQQLFELLGSVFSLIIAFYFYKQIGNILASNLHFSIPLSNILGFILLVTVFSGLVGFLGKRWHDSRKSEPIAVFDGSLGAVFGGFKAALIGMIVLLIFLALPWDFIHGPIEASAFANDLLRLTPCLFAVQDQALPSDFPRMVISTEGLKWRSIDYKKLENATCIACGSKVVYKGLVKKGLLYYPQTYCPKCGRISDGCLTFEGYHMLYGECPYEQFGNVGTTDCKIWPNLKPASVKGKCPVCGKSQ